MSEEEGGEEEEEEEEEVIDHLEEGLIVLNIHEHISGYYIYIYISYQKVMNEEVEFVSEARRSE